MHISVKTFKVISILEAISFLLLLCFAMPLKYIWGHPEFVEVIGMLHGILFIAYLYGAFSMFTTLKWSKKTLFIVLICAVLPFGPIYADKKYLPNNL
jgi:integral membrane protein